MAETGFPHPGLPDGSGSGEHGRRRDETRRPRHGRRARFIGGVAAAASLMGLGAGAATLLGRGDGGTPVAPATAAPNPGADPSATPRPSAPETHSPTASPSSTEIVNPGLLTGPEAAKAHETILAGWKAEASKMPATLKEAAQRGHMQTIVYTQAANGEAVSAGMDDPTTMPKPGVLKTVVTMGLSSSPEAAADLAYSFTFTSDSEGKVVPVQMIANHYAEGTASDGLPAGQPYDLGQDLAPDSKRVPLQSLTVTWEGGIAQESRLFTANSDTTDIVDLTDIPTSSTAAQQGFYTADGMRTYLWPSIENK